MRYKSMVNIKVHELAMLLMVYYAFASNPEELGEAGDDDTYENLCKALDAQSEIKITPKQLYDLTWYFKQAVLERVKLYKYIMPKNYYAMFKELAKQNPEFFYERPGGEIVMRDSDDIYKLD
jgi:hypothetical protein